MKKPKLSDPSDAIRAEIEAIVARFVSTLDEGANGYRTPVPNLSVARVTAPVPPTTHSDAACVCVCIRGRRKIAVGDTVFVHQENRFLLTAVEVPSIIAIPDASDDRPYTALRIDLDLDMARQIMAEIDQEGIPLVADDFRRATVPLDRDFLDCVARLVRLIECPSDIAFMSPLLHRELIYRLLSGPGGARLRQIVRWGSSGHRVAKAIDWLRRHYREPLLIEDLAARAGMGVSTLHRRFHELTSMSPIQYQKQLRLHAARRLLLEAHVNVGMAAMRVGYESPTQFSREYRRLFGESPLRDVKKLRARGGDRPAA